MSDDIAQGVCKTVRSLGLSPVETRKIVDGVVFTIQHNGPDWFMDRIKGLRSYYAGLEEFPAWISKKHRHSDGLLKPKGWMGYIVGSRRDPDTIVTVCATIIGAITYTQPTEKQLHKWSEAVTNPPSADASIDEDLADAMPSMTSLEPRLKAKLARIQSFGPDNISGTRVPVGYDSVHIKRGQKLDVRSIYDGYCRSLESAPSNSWSFMDQSGIRLPGLSTQQSRPILNRMRKSAPDFAKKKTDRKRSTQAYPIGHISFLQQPFGKLRTVANPNRFVQWQLIPLGETLSDWVNDQPGVFVTNQEGGILWASNRLRDGVSLTSADLSSASDTLDYRKVTRILKNAGAEMRKHLEYFEWCSQQSWFVENEQAQDYLKSKGCDPMLIRWKQGQPLGLRPSFPVLTLCNLVAARKAVHDVDNTWPGDDPPFAIVGDDIVIETKYAAAYSNAITAMGGITNLDKSVTSSESAEMCSRLITRNNVIRLKARYIDDNDPQNFLTYQDTSLHVKMSGWVKRYCQRVGSYSLIESGLVPMYNGSQPKRISTRDLFHTVLSLEKGEQAMEEKLSSLTMFYAYQHRTSEAEMKPSSKLTHKPTRKLIDASYQDRVRRFKIWNPDYNVDQLPLDLGLVGKYYRQTWDSWIDKSLRELEINESARAKVPGVRWIRDPNSGPEALHEVEAVSAREQRVNSVKLAYDYKHDSFSKIEDPTNQIRSLHRKVDQFERDLISDDAGDHLIRRVPNPHGQDSGVDELIEDKGRHYEVSFHSKHQSSDPVTVEKTIPAESKVPEHRDYKIPDAVRRLMVKAREIPDCPEQAVNLSHGETVDGP
jgi:hypothetical protein